MAKLTKSAKEVRGRHQLTVRVKTSKYRDKSSNRWLERQLNDPYVAESKRLGYRSRAAFKLIQLDERYHFLGKGKTIVDLGCAPGGCRWRARRWRRTENRARAGRAVRPAAALPRGRAAAGRAAAWPARRSGAGSPAGAPSGRFLL